MRTVALLLLTVLLFPACRDSRLELLTDPWLEPYARTLAAEYETAHPGTTVTLKVWSTEQAARMLRYGYRADVFLYLDSLSLNREGLESRVQARLRLGSERMALLRARVPAQVQAFRTDTCVAVPATGRPCDRAVRAWQAADSSLRLPPCTLTANFPAQEQDYLLRGWVPLSLGPRSLGLRHLDRVDVLREGPLLAGYYQAVVLTDAPNPEAAAAFFSLMQEEKSRRVLATMNFLP